MVRKISIIIIVVLCHWCIFDYLICITEASTFITQIRTHPAHPGKCWDGVTKRAYKPGNKINVQNECIQIVCTKDLRFAGSGCSPMMAAADENCEEIPGDETQSYPFCCPRLRCIDESGNNFIF